LLAGLRKADELLLAINKEAISYVTTPKLQSLLLWMEEVTDPTPGDFQPIGKRALVIANAYAIDYFVQYANWAIKFEIYQGLDLTTAISMVEKLRKQIPDNKQPQAVKQKFGRQLIEIFLATFHLTPEMVDLSKEEIQALDNYLHGVRLLIECECAAVRRTPEVWSQIEEWLLRPAATTN
jgi:hypothetical protein